MVENWTIEFRLLNCVQFCWLDVSTLFVFSYTPWNSHQTLLSPCPCLLISILNPEYMVLLPSFMKSCIPQTLQWSLPKIQHQPESLLEIACFPSSFGGYKFLKRNCFSCFSIHSLCIMASSVEFVYLWLCVFSPTQLKYTVQWILVYSHGCANITLFPERFITLNETPYPLAVTSPSAWQLLISVSGLAYYGCFI